MKPVFVRKKRLLQIRWMLRCLRIKCDIKGSSIKERKNLKGYKVRGVFQSRKKQGLNMMI